MSEHDFDASFEINGQDGELQVMAVRGVERLSEPFTYVVEFRCPAVGLDDARGGTALLTLGEGERFVAGIVESLEVEGLTVPEAERGNGYYRAILRPQHYITLAYRRGFRIFQEKTVVDIIKAVFTEASIPDDTIDWAGVTGSYPTRVYTVQYDESEWDFIHRLMEEEGIFYAFEHAPEGARMIMMDSNAAFRPTDPPSLPYDDRKGGLGGRLAGVGDSVEAAVWDWRERRKIVESKVTLRDFDFDRPASDLTVAASAEEVLPREHYAYPGFYDDEGEGQRLAQVRLDAFRSTRVTSSAQTSFLPAMPGQYFELANHHSFGGEHVITGVRIELVLRQAVGTQLLDTTAQTGGRVFLDVLPREQTFRAPRRTPKPKVIGLQTALVAGPAGEEIHVDQFGRVKVQFFWDRQGVGDEKASCWMRLTQAHTTGSVMIPRIGWEVLVEFIDGDADRPVCLGRVWNPNTHPPHELPASKTMSSHGSVSTPGSGGVNEIVMDDAAGSERLIINAQKNQTTVVANNRTTSVGANLDHAVSANRTVDIGGNETRAILANENDSVTGNLTIAVGGTRTVKASGTATEETTGSMALTVGGMESITVGSPASALLDVVAEAAIDKAAGAAASAADRAQAALLGPIAPALDAAKGAIGKASEFSGKASGLLGPGAPAMPELAGATAALSKVAGAADAGAFASGLAKSTLSGALAKAMGGGGGGGPGAGPGGAAGASGGGSGTWGMTVGGAVTETVGGVAVISSAKGVAFTIGGSNTELVGAARVELIHGGKSETTGGAKAETVGVYMVKAGKSYGVEAKAAAGLNVAGSSTHDIGGGHSIAAKGAVLISAGATTMDASGTITLSCGACKVVISQGGISIEGAAEVELKGGDIETNETSLGT